jgi:uncharacterized membrane protein/protein-disulfide isomerase
MSSRIRWVIFALSLVGFGFATASAWVHYKVLTDPAYISPCDISTTFNCTQVYLSRFGSVGGVPVALGGMVWFGLTALISGLAQPTESRSAAAGYLLALAVIGMGCVLYLGYASFAVLRTGCLLCIGTYISVAGIFVASLMSRSVPFAELPVRVSSDLRAAFGRPVALVLVILYLAGAVGAVALFPREEELTARRAAEAATAPAPGADAQQDFATAWAQQPRQDLGSDPDGAKVVIVKFNDYECPACRQYEVHYKPIIEKFAASHPKEVKYVVKDWPWNSACNFNTMSTIPGHEAACDAAAAVRMARDRGKYAEMVEWIYANQGTSPAELRAATQRIVGVTDFDREYAQKLPDIRRDIADGGVLGINSTPTYFINGVRLPGGMMPLQYFELAINLELQNAQ